MKTSTRIILLVGSVIILNKLGSLDKVTKLGGYDNTTKALGKKITYSIIPGLGFVEEIVNAAKIMYNMNNK